MAEAAPFEFQPAIGRGLAHDQIDLDPALQVQQVEQPLVAYRGEGGVRIHVEVCADLGWMAALLADVGLTFLYSAYGYAFHLVFDRLRPVTSSA